MTFVFPQIAAFPDGLQLFAVELPLNPLYLNMLLANLNARRLVRNVDGRGMSLESRIIADLALVGLESSPSSDNKHVSNYVLALHSSRTHPDLEFTSVTDHLSRSAWRPCALFTRKTPTSVRQEALGT